MATKVCRHCGEEFELRPGKPGLIDECPAHSHEVAELSGGNMIYEHKTAPYIEVKSMRLAKQFASAVRRGFGGVTRSIVTSREPSTKDRSAVEGATYYSRLGEKRTVRGGSQQ